MTSSAPSPETVAQLKTLIGFNTVSRESNLDLIHYIDGYLKNFGVEATLTHDSDGRKANLFATIGPTDRSGIALSGHTDVVPIDGQDWSSDPFALKSGSDRVFGRGTADMKGFIAVVLAAVPNLVERSLRTPLHLAFTYDEEVGCLGVRTLLEWLRTQPVIPKGVVVGEPTGMQVVTAHKGKHSYRAHVHGLESHSGLAHMGANAVEAAAEAIAYLKSLARKFRDEGPFDHALTPPYTTVHTGVVSGGTQLNIVPKYATFDFECRHLPEDDPFAIFEDLKRHIDRAVLPEMQAVFPDARFEWIRRSEIPGLDAHPESEIVQLIMALTGRNHTEKVSFGTEAGFFVEANMPSVICGPGYIEQAHKPDEYVELSQLAECEAFLVKLAEHCE